MQRETRTSDEIIGDLLADDYSLQEIADWMCWPIGAVRQRYIVICAKLGVKPDGD